MQPLRRYAKRPPGAQGQPGKELGHIVLVEPIERSPQAVVVECVGGDTGTQQMLNGRVGKELRDQIQPAIAEPQPIEDQGHRGRADAHLLTVTRLLLVQPSRYADFSTDFGHDP